MDAIPKEMCHFITAICSSKTNLIEINSVGENYFLRFEVCENEHIKSQLSSTEKYLLKTTKMCDCGTSLGEAVFKKDNKERIQKSEVDKLKKKGWSENKISRFLSDKKKTEDRISIQNDLILNRQSNELENYANFIKEVLIKTDTEIFGLLLHWYSKGPQNERIEILHRKIVSSENLTSTDFKTLKEDILLCITK